MDIFWNRPISPRAYIFQRPFLRSICLEGLICGGAYLRRKICVSKSIWLALQLEVNLPFLLCFILCLRVIFQVLKPPGGLYLDFLLYPFRGLIFGGAYTWRGLFSEFYGNKQTLGWNAAECQPIYQHTSWHIGQVLTDKSVDMLTDMTTKSQPICQLTCQPSSSR